MFLVRGCQATPRQRHANLPTAKKRRSWIWRGQPWVNSRNQPQANCQLRCGRLVVCCMGCCLAAFCFAARVERSLRPLATRSAPSLLLLFSARPISAFRTAAAAVRTQERDVRGPPSSFARIRHSRRIRKSLPLPLLGRTPALCSRHRRKAPRRLDSGRCHCIRPLAVRRQ